MRASVQSRMLAVVRVDALTRIILRTARLLDLEEKRIILSRHHERDRAPRANAADFTGHWNG
jgi:hypothetical protein